MLCETGEKDKKCLHFPLMGGGIEGQGGMIISQIKSNKMEK